VALENIDLFERMRVSPIGFSLAMRNVLNVLATLVATQPRLSLAGDEFPSENHHKNDYSGDRSPSAALLELLMVYHGAPHKPYYGIV
jgi:hypothetical protein